jgi:hypothetical protein
VTVRTQESTETSGNNAVQANCLSGEQATGGGVSLREGDASNVSYFEPGGAPVGTAPPTGWRSSWFSSSVVRIRVYAVYMS